MCVVLDCVNSWTSISGGMGVSVSLKKKKRILTRSFDSILCTQYYTRSFCSCRGLDASSIRVRNRGMVFGAYVCMLLCCMYVVDSLQRLTDCDLEVRE